MGGQAGGRVGRRALLHSVWWNTVRDMCCIDVRIVLRAPRALNVVIMICRTAVVVEVLRATCCSRQAGSWARAPGHLRHNAVSIRILYIQ